MSLTIILFTRQNYIGEIETLFLESTEGGDYVRSALKQILLRKCIFLYDYIEEVRWMDIMLCEGGLPLSAKNDIMPDGGIPFFRGVLIKNIISLV